jgi:hypothetical protein
MAPVSPGCGRRSCDGLAAAYREYKSAIVPEYDRATDSGARAALLRREGLYHSRPIE